MRPDDGTKHDQLISELQRAFTEALLAGDETVAESLLREGIEAGIDEAAMDDGVITPALRVVGDLWEAGQLSIAQEHLATEIALRVIALQRDLHRVVRRRAARVVVLAAVDGEQHVVGLRMAGSLLTHAGYDVKQLGASVPTHALGVIVDRLSAHVVALTATMPSATPVVPDAVGMVRTVRPTAGIVLGGVGIPARYVEQPGLKRCERVGEVVAVVDALAQRASMN
jgi:MerR family transcriptional regulator, light-induced transcriptional regulator